MAIREGLEYMAGYIWGFVPLIFGDPTVTSLTLGCICLGFLVNVLLAITVFFFGYVLLRFVNSLSLAIGVPARQIAQAFTFKQGPHA